MIKIGKLNISKRNLIIIGVVILIVIGGIILLTKSNSKGLFYNPDKNIKIVKSEASKIELEDYKTNEFSIKIPKGWKVDTLGDYIHYTIKVYNPDKPLYQFFLNMKTEGYNKSEDAKRWQQKYYPNDMFAKTSVIATKDTEGFYKIFNDLGTLNNTSRFTFPTLTEFTVIDNLGKGSLGGDMLRATFKDQDGNAYVYTVSEENSIGYQVEYSQESNNSFIITNKYIDVTNADVQLNAHKDLVGGKTLTAGMYQFDLISNGEVIDSQVNDDQGDIHFNTLSFDQEGTYTYQVKEHISDNDPHIEYDQSVYQVTVDVKRQDNRLVPTVTYTLDDQDVSSITFTNIYHPLNLTVQKRSKDLSQDPLEGAVYGLYRVNKQGKDILVEKQLSDSEGYMTYNNAVPGYKYYFKEISAPNGHTVDEYKTKTFEVSYQKSESGKFLIN